MLLCVNINTKEIHALEVAAKKVHADGKVIEHRFQKIKISR